ncbi:telomere length regulation protein-domain-containing protein [Mycena floridula]|nr:telomere length regulation protein-domain-containing protein [Mycena floridula]
MSTDAYLGVRQIISELQAPVSDVTTLLSLLCGPLDCLDLLPPQFRQHNTRPLPAAGIIVPKHLPLLQRVILENIVISWQSSLVDIQADVLLDQYFCPDAFSYATEASGQVVISAYSTILSTPLLDYSIRLLARMTIEYPMDRMHSAVFRVDGDHTRQQMNWEDFIRNLAGVPARVANSLGNKAAIPPLLEQGNYFNHISRRCECLLERLSAKKGWKQMIPRIIDNNVRSDSMSSVAYVITKLVNLGVFPSSPPTTRSQSSFFGEILPVIRTRLESNGALYSQAWIRVFGSLSSVFTLKTILTSLFASLPVQNRSEILPNHRAMVKREARLLSQLIGPLVSGAPELWDAALSVILDREWAEGYSRLFVCWVAGAGKKKVDEGALAAFLDRVMDLWASKEYVSHSLLSRHRYMTSLVLLTISCFSKESSYIKELGMSPHLLGGVSNYISHADNAVRRCGMLTAEVVAQAAGKRLDFRDWDGDEPGKPWAREMRLLIKEGDVDADLALLDALEDPVTVPSSIETPSASSKSQIVLQTAEYDSDDSLTGYISPSSSRSSSPTPSELDEIEKDPTLGVGIKKIARPVYLAQLGAMLRGPVGAKQSDSGEEADKIEMALNCAEELIRKKRGYGTELDENAVNLAYGLIALNNNFELDGFDVKRQNALRALVACSPRKAAPSIIEEFFKNQYSTDQRYLMLNALALGARELASLPVPTTVDQARIAFPSKTLAPALHIKYLDNGQPSGQILPQILEGISRQAIDRESSEAPEHPVIIRERRLRVKNTRVIKEIDETPASSTFIHVAAEFFVAPLINRFWLFLRDEQTREERTTHLEGRQQYRAGGTGLILNPVVLAQFLTTLAILVHACYLAPEWTAIIGPDALEIAVTMGTKPISLTELESHDDDSDNVESKEASVLSSALELALVVLDRSFELDGGRSLGLEQTALLLGTGEWAEGVFSRLEKGIRIGGGGGAQEVRLRRVVAAVLLKVDAITSKWRRSMMETA